MQLFTQNPSSTLIMEGAVILISLTFLEVCESSTVQQVANVLFTTTLEFTIRPITVSESEVQVILQPKFKRMTFSYKVKTTLIVNSNVK